MNVDLAGWPGYLLSAFGGAALLRGLAWGGFVHQHGAPMVVDTLKNDAQAIAAVTAIADKAIAAHDAASAETHREHARAVINDQVQRVDGEIRQLVESAVAAAAGNLAAQITSLGEAIERREQEKARHAADLAATLGRLSTDVAQLRALVRGTIDTPRELAGRGMPADAARRHDSGRLPPPEPLPRRPTPPFGVPTTDTDE